MDYHMCTMKKAPAAIKAPALPKPEVAASKITELIDEDNFNHINLAGADLSYQQAKDVLIEEARISNVKFTGSALEKLSLRDARLDTCDLSNVEWKASRVTRVEIANSRLTGFRAAETKFSNCRFIDCGGKLIQLQTAHFEHSLFENCDLSGCDFRYCDLEGTIFKDCNLSEAIFYDARLKEVDFRGSDLRGILAHPKDLVGAIISPQQAVDFAAHFATLLGLTIAEP
jgi:uncharacterized protein YjbI with pentapeptide repeats